MNIEGVLIAAGQNLKRYLAKQGDVKGAIETATRAIEVGKAADPKTDTAALEKLIAEWKAKK